VHEAGESIEAQHRAIFGYPDTSSCSCMTLSRARGAAMALFEALRKYFGEEDPSPSERLT